MHFRDVFCRPFSFTLDEYKFCVSHAQTFQFTALVILILFAVDPHGYRNHMPVWGTLPIWIASTVAFMATCCALFSLLVWFTLRVRKIRIFSWIISLAGFLVAAWVGQFLAEIHSHGSYVRSSWQQLSFFALAVVMLETIYFGFVMPQTIQKRLPPVETPTPAPTQTLKIGAREVRLEVVLYIVSEEHYVRVVMRHDKLIQRARLADLTAQTTPAQGFQPHRSWWVSINAKPTITRTGTKPTLTLCDGTIVPIARGRLKDTQHWIDAHANWDLDKTA
jgi:signal transduction histidine kinase